MKKVTTTGSSSLETLKTKLEQKAVRSISKEHRTPVQSKPTTQINSELNTNDKYDEYLHGSISAEN